jgi:hypothetical protein
MLATDRRDGDCMNIDWSKGRSVRIPGMGISPDSSVTYSGPLVLPGMRTDQFVRAIEQENVRHEGDSMTPDYRKELEAIRLSSAEADVLRRTARDGVVPDVKAEDEYRHLVNLGAKSLINGKFEADGVRYHASQRGLDLLAILDGSKP